MRGIRRIHLRSWHALVVVGAAAAVLAGTLTQASAAGPPGAFLKQGNNGFPAPNDGAAKKVDEGVNGNGALLTSISGGTNQAGLVGVPGGDGTAFGALTDVSTQFNVTQGTCTGGAPRWEIDLINPSNPKDTQFLLVYFDNSHGAFGGCNAGTQQETNITNNPTTGWFVGNSSTPETYSQVNATYGNWKLKDVAENR